MGIFVWIFAIRLEQITNLSHTKKYVKINKGFCGVSMPSDDTKIEFYQCQKYSKTPSIIYAVLESLTKEIDGCKNHLEKLSARKVGKHISCEYSMSMVYKWGICIQSWITCKHLTVKRGNAYHLQTNCRNDMKRQKLKISTLKIKKYYVKDHCHFTDKYRYCNSLCNLKFISIIS